METQLFLLKMFAIENALYNGIIALYNVISIANISFHVTNGSFTILPVLL